MPRFSLSLDQQETFDAALFKSRIALAIHIIVVPLYWVFLQVTLHKTPLTAESTTENIGQFRVILYVLAISMVAGSFFLRKFLLRFKPVVCSRDKLDSSAIESICAKQLVAMMGAAALCEAAVLFGLVLSLMTKSSSDFCSLASIGVPGLLFYFPRRAVWEDWLFQNVK